MKRWRLAVAVAALMISAGSSLAATLIVATTGVDSASCGTSSSPCRHIQYAIDERAVDGDFIRVRAGTYNECIFIETGPATGAITVETEAFAANGALNAATIDGTGVCDAASLTPGPVVVIFDRSVIRGFRIQKGGDSGVWAFGNVAITNNTITQNTTPSFAGGIFAYTGYYVTVADRKMEIKSNTISNNSAAGSGGGLYLLAPGLDFPSVVEIQDNVINTNTAGPATTPLAPGAFGGGLTILTDSPLSANTSSVVITRNTIDGNTASNSTSGYPSYGGGLFVATGVFYGYGTETITIGEAGEANSIRNNVVGAYGGGVSVNLQPRAGGHHSIAVASNSVSANSGGRGGGGIHGFFLMSDPDSGGTGTIEIKENTVTGNHANGLPGSGVLGGGGLFAEMYSMRTPADRVRFEVERNAFQVNDSRSLGGGASMFAYADSDPELNGVIFPAAARIDFKNNVVTGNKAINPSGGGARGGGVWAAGRAFGQEAQATIDQDFLTVAANETDAGAGGLEWEAYPEEDSNLTTGFVTVELSNSILSRNEGFAAGGAIAPGFTVTVDARYNDAFENGGPNPNWESNLGINTGTNGNISVDPGLDALFVPQLCSPTIDAGDPALPAAPEPEPNGGAVNMGHLGGTANATRTLPDANADGVVDGIDVLSLAAAFNATDPDPRFNASVDFDSNLTVDGLDLSYLAALYARSCP